jgi:hypothetical protein
LREFFLPPHSLFRQDVSEKGFSEETFIHFWFALLKWPISGFFFCLCEIVVTDPPCGQKEQRERERERERERNSERDRDWWNTEE